jgi:large subunit ribosomal protein L15
MSLHTLGKTRGARSRKIRVGRGRGSGKGKTCGRGTKGQMSRSGHKHKLGFEGGQIPLVRRSPKRGFTNPTRTVYIPVDVVRLICYEDGADVGMAALRQQGLANGGRIKVKILGKGPMERKLQVSAHAFSSAARKVIEDAGGSCTVVT